MSCHPNWRSRIFFTGVETTNQFMSMYSHRCKQAIPSPISWYIDTHRYMCTWHPKRQEKAFRFAKGTFLWNFGVSSPYFSVFLWVPRKCLWNMPLLGIHCWMFYNLLDVFIKLLVSKVLAIPGGPFPMFGPICRVGLITYFRGISAETPGSFGGKTW